MLACNHVKYRRALISAAIRIKREMPAFCAEAGIHRVEARCWHGHPTAAKFLKAVGFDFETNMRGFGGQGTASFDQFAWTNPDLKGDHQCA
jgi:RimJ/RimL family protein N-acetyltransferase